MRCLFLSLLVALSTASTPSTIIAQESMSPDAKTLKALVEAGSDLSKPHEINHWLYFPSESNARAAAKDLSAAEFSIVAVGQAEDLTHWRVRILKTIVPTLEDLEQQSAFLETLAQRHDGEYDGWETQVED